MIGDRWSGGDFPRGNDVMRRSRSVEIERSRTKSHVPIPFSDFRLPSLDLDIPCHAERDKLDTCPAMAGLDIANFLPV